MIYVFQVQSFCWFFPLFVFLYVNLFVTLYEYMPCLQLCFAEYEFPDEMLFYITPNLLLTIGAFLKKWA